MLVWPDTPPRRHAGRPPAPRAPSPESPPPHPASTEGSPRAASGPPDAVADRGAEPGAVVRPGDPVGAYWGLAEPAFDNAPNPKFLYRSAQHAAALGALLRAAESGGRFATLTGAYGCGKTLVSRALIQRLDPARYEVALLVHPTLNVVEFLREILYQVGIETAAGTEAALKERLREVMLDGAEAGRATVIMVDEAQLIDEPVIRLLLSLATDDRAPVTLVLIGTDELDQRLAGVPDLGPRVTARVDPLGNEETGEYIAHRLRVAGRRDMVFTAAAVTHVFEGSGGRPRMINNLCELALLIASVDRLPRVDRDAIEAARREVEGRRDG